MFGRGVRKTNEKLERPGGREEGLTFSRINLAGWKDRKPRRISMYVFIHTFTYTNIYIIT